MEPWYESQEITPAEVKLVIQQSWFHRELFSERSSEHSNIQLCNLLYDDNRKINPPYRHITFESMWRQSANWQEQSTKVLSKEIEREGSFGSHRGFYTFCRAPLMRAYAKGVIRECWAKPVLAKFARQWLKHHYAYGNIGFLNANARFKIVASR